MIRRLTLLLLLLLTIVAVPARSDPRTLVITDELQLGLAATFMAEGEYYRAVTEYKKFLYFFPDSDKADFARLQIGLALYHGGECTRAIESFARVRQSYPSEYFTTAALYEGVCRQRLKNPGAAMDDFERVVAADPAAPEAAEALAGLSLAALDREDFDGSRQALQRLVTDYSDLPKGVAAKEALPLVDAADSSPRKSPVAAGAMSAFLPGSGYAYAGRPRDVLTAFLVNGLFIAGTVVAIEDENYPAAVLLGGVGIPFYLGNIYGSADAARKWNLGIAQDLRKELALRLEYHF